MKRRPVAVVLLGLVSASSALAAEWLYLKGYGHLNERGNAIAAQLLDKYLAEGDPHDVARRPLLGIGGWGPGNKR